MIYSCISAQCDQLSSRCLLSHHSSRSRNFFRSSGISSAIEALNCFFKRTNIVLAVYALEPDCQQRHPHNAAPAILWFQSSSS
jgi:hypothetical protein